MNKLLALFALSTCSLYGVGYSSGSASGSPAGSVNSLPNSGSLNTGSVNSSSYQNASNGIARPDQAMRADGSMNPALNPSSSNSNLNPAARNGNPALNNGLNPSSNNNLNDGSKIDPRSPDLNHEVESQIKHVQSKSTPTQDFASTFKDKAINTQIRNKINSWYADDYKHITLNTEDGVVNINGTAEKPQVARDLADSTKKIDGVKEVNNNVKSNSSK